MFCIFVDSDIFLKFKSRFGRSGCVSLRGKTIETASLKRKKEHVHSNSNIHLNFQLFHAILRAVKYTVALCEGFTDIYVWLKTQYFFFSFASHFCMLQELVQRYAFILAWNIHLLCFRYSFASSRSCLTNPLAKCSILLFIFHHLSSHNEVLFIVYTRNHFDASQVYWIEYEREECERFG